MSRLTFGLAAALAGLVLAPNLASALSGVTTSSTDLRAGPAFDFPVVDQVPGDVSVTVHGCVRGYRWCDVSWRDARGWLPGEELAYLYEGRRVAIIEYGPRIGLPVVGFAFDTYWDRYYRGRSWYGERARWRSVWRERDRNERGASGGVRVRPDRATEPRREITEPRREIQGRKIDESDRDRRVNRIERPDVRTGRGERDRGDTKGYGYNPTPRGTNGGMQPRGENRPPMARDRGPASQGGVERGGQRGSERGGGPGQGDRRP